MIVVCGYCKEKFPNIETVVWHLPICPKKPKKKGTESEEDEKL